MTKFKFDRETDTVTMPATWWRALASTHHIQKSANGKIRYIEPRGVFENTISDAFLKDPMQWSAEDIEEFFALIASPGRGASR